MINRILILLVLGACINLHAQNVGINETGVSPSYTPLSPTGWDSNDRLFVFCASS